MSGVGIIYGLVCPISEKVRYVGQTTQPLKYRLAKHKKCEGTTHKDRWLQKLSADNALENLEAVILETCPVEALNEREVFWISFYRQKNGKNFITNSCDGGHGVRGYKHTDDAKVRIGLASRMQIRKPATELTRSKIGDASIGNTYRLGKMHSKETKEKISNSKKGKASWNASPVLQISPEGEVIREWRSASHAAKMLGISSGNILSVIGGNRKTAGGYIWQRKFKAAFNGGYTHSDETKKKIAKANKGKNARPIRQLTLEGAYVKDWSSYSEILKELGIRNVTAVAKGHRSQAGGYKWRYIDELERNS
jgi:group I intron endonuclease